MHRRGSSVGEILAHRDRPERNLVAVGGGQDCGQLVGAGRSDCGRGGMLVARADGEGVEIARAVGFAGEYPVWSDGFAECGKRCGEIGRANPGWHQHLSHSSLSTLEAVPIAYRGRVQRLAKIGVLRCHDGMGTFDRRTAMKLGGTAALAALVPGAALAANAPPRLFVFDSRYPASREAAERWRSRGAALLDPRERDLGPAWRQEIKRALDNGGAHCRPHAVVGSPGLRDDGPRPRAEASRDRVGQPALRLVPDLANRPGRQGGGFGP